MSFIYSQTGAFPYVARQKSSFRSTRRLPIWPQLIVSQAARPQSSDRRTFMKGRSHVAENPNLEHQRYKERERHCEVGCYCFAKKHLPWRGFPNAQR